MTDIESPLLKDLRETYTQGELNDAALSYDPWALFERWFDEHLSTCKKDANAMILATQGLDGYPKQRTVLAKGIRDSEIVFYTNYQSDKAREIEANSKVSILFPWHEQERQVITKGVAIKIPFAETDNYFQSRPRASQLGAWVSKQSTPIASREQLEQKQKKLAERFHDTDIPTPDFWGGFAVRLFSIEFWQGRPSRLHDRIRFERDAANDGAWRSQRISP